MQAAATENQSTDLHEIIWGFLQKYFTSPEILEIINNCDKYNNHLLHNAILNNSKDIIELTWTKCQSFLKNADDEIKYLKKEGKHGKNIKKLSLENERNEAQVWVNEIIKKYEIKF